MNAHWPRLVVCSTFQELSIRPHLVSHCNRPFLKLQVKSQATNDSLQNSISTEPKWKEKLAAADENAQRMRLQSQQVHEEYKRRIATLQRENLQGPKNACSLEELEFISYLDDEGLIVDKSASDAKASVYAIFDQNRTLQYVGISRQVYLSMKLHFARVPSKCYFVKIHHLNKPNRALLECIKEKWIEENGLLPSGNDNGPQQKIWENPLDCKPLMTEEENKLLETDPGTQQAKILKNVARRIEKELDATYKERNCNEKFWFDPKLKEKGLLELRNKKPNQSVPTSVPKPKSAS
ncbi:uncharacterized protein LOC131049504 isoform X2 [Cryptomeria japonica]|uniref:uncharacterized protein LOC131049504 isoform X2 n=1 Tax=Cryptomeria japonica TaxID=3369 RepID=UPI0027DA9DCB|nr:uncharacterized protein LOC131049504 isoform X2 [Cryptomeria japonica]